MAQAIAQARSWKSVRILLVVLSKPSVRTPRTRYRLPLGRRTLKYLIRLGKGCGTGLRRIAQVPEESTTDNGRKVHFVGETMAVLLIRCQRWSRTAIAG